jgi:hypothetical protein
MATMQLYAEIAYRLQCAIFLFDLIKQISGADREAYIHFFDRSLNEIRVAL